MNVLWIGGIAVAWLMLGIASLHAQDKTTTGKQAERDLLGASCGDYIMGLGIANPGDNATAEQKMDAEQAQDDIVSAVMWVHGYTSAKQPDGRFPPLTETWMRDTVVKLAQSCKTHSPDGKMRLADAATRL